MVMNICILMSLSRVRLLIPRLIGIGIQILRNLNEGEIQEASALLTLLENVSANVMIVDKRIRKLSPSRIFSCKSFFGSVD